MKQKTGKIFRKLALGSVLLILCMLIAGCREGLTTDHSSCSDEGDPRSDNPRNSIKITSVSPSSGLIDGENTVMEVTVDFTFGWSPNSPWEAELNIGFNSTNPYRCDFIPGEEQIVDRGDGSHTFIVSVPVKDWKQFGDFEVFVYLVENLDPDPFWPLAHDSKILTF